MASSATPSVSRLKLFISYSRADADFTDQLQAALGACGFEVSVDRQAPGGIEWWNSLRRLIRECDTVVFVLSPTSVRSSHCADEVREAASLNKRILTLTCRQLEPGAPPDDGPMPLLGHIQSIFFYADAKFPGSGFGAGLARLIEALNLDHQWILEHTRLMEMAYLWNAQGRPQHLLLAGPSIGEARDWAARKPPVAPPPTDLHMAFIEASGGADAARLDAERRRLEDMAAAQAEARKALDAALDAQKQRARFQRRSSLAIALAGLLVLAAGLAALAQIRANTIREARVFSNLATLAIQAENYELAMRYALSGLPPRGAIGWLSPPTGELAAKLAGAAQSSRMRATLPGRAMFSPDGRRVLAWTPTRVTLADGRTGEQRQAPPITDGRLLAAAYPETGPVGLVLTKAGAIHARDLETGRTAELALSTGKAHHEAQLSPSGRYAILGEPRREKGDNSHSVVEVSTGRLIAKLSRPGERVANSGFAPGESHAVAIVEEGPEQQATLRAVALPDGTVAMEYSVRRGHVNLHFTGDPRVVALRPFCNETFSIYDFLSGRELANITTGSKVIAIAFNGQSNRVLTAQEDGTARLWNVADGQFLATLRGHTQRVTDAQFSPDGIWIATASEDASVRLWSVDTLAQRAILVGHTEGVARVNFSPDSRTILSTTLAGRGSRLWSGGYAGVLREPNNDAPYSVVTPRHCGPRVLFKSPGTPAYLQTMNPAGGRRGLEDGDGDVVAAGFSNDQSHVFINYKDGRVRVWKVGAPKPVATMTFNTANYRAIAISDDGRRVLGHLQNEFATVLDVATGARLAEIKFENRSGLTRSLLLPDGKRFVTQEDAGPAVARAARVWEVDTGKPVATIGNESDRAFDMSLTADGRRIYRTSWSGETRIFDAETGAEVLKLEGHSSLVLGVTWSPDGKRIATHSSDKTVRLWDAATGRQLGLLRGHEGAVMASSFNADGSRVITTGDDRTVRIWDTATATEIAALKGHTHYGRRACFSDGEPTAWSIGGNVLVWDIAWTEPRSGEALRDAVCATRLKGAERFSETEMQDPVLRGAPELRDA